MRPPCRNKTGYEQPDDYPFWHLNPETIAAQRTCFTCPLQQACATNALKYGTPDGVVIAGVICRGDDRTQAMLETITNPPEPEPLAQVIPITAARRGRRPRNIWPTPCAVCDRDMMPHSRMAAGFVRHLARGVCMACYQAERRQAAA